MKIKNSGSQIQPQNSSQFVSQKTKKLNRKYCRITSDVKDKLIFLIVRNNMSIKHAAIHMKINYSTAKFIFNQYRQKNQKCQNNNIEKNDVRIMRLNEGQEDNVKLRCTVGGKFQAQSTKIYTAEEVFRMNINQNYTNKIK